MDHQELPSSFIFSSKVTAKELHESFINTNNVNFTKLTEVLSEKDYECTPNEALKRQPFNYISDGKKYVSFLSRPRTELDENSRLCEAVFYEHLQDENISRAWRKGFQKYLAILSHTINSAPGDDTLWPYGRYELIEIDGNVGSKFVSAGLLHRGFEGIRDDSQTEYFEVSWQEVYEPYQLNLNLKNFGLMLCNFKDKPDEEFGAWPFLLKVLSDFEKLDNPAVDKVAIRQTALQIINKYIAVRKNTFHHDQLGQDIQKFKELLNFKEIQNIHFNNLNFDSKLI